MNVVPYLDMLESKRGVPLERTFQPFGEEAVRQGDYGYDVLLIDASNDSTLRDGQFSSAYFKDKNPNLLVIGMSVDDGLLTDKMAGRLYEERICGDYNLDGRLFNILKRHGLVETAEVPV